MTRRFFQFSLGSLLFFVALICVVLAVRSNRQHNRRVAIVKIEKLGGKIMYLSKFREWTAIYVYRPKGSPARVDLLKEGLMARLLGDTSNYVVSVRFDDDSKGKVTDVELAGLLSLTEVREITIRNSPVTDAGLMSLASLPDLVCIVLLGKTDVTDEGIAEFHTTNPKCQVFR